MGPIGVAAHLAPYLPGHPAVPHTGGEKAIGVFFSCLFFSWVYLSLYFFPSQPVSAAPFSSASILPISWMYLRLMGGSGITQATKIAIVSANYMASRLAPYYQILYRGSYGTSISSECLIFLIFFRSSRSRVYP